MKYKITEDEHTIWIQWGRLGKHHIGWSEELSFGGLNMILDRNKKGEVCALEIIKN